MSQVKSVCVYCGSSTVSDPAFDAPTIELGRRLAESGITLVYGGGNPGLMGKVTDACMKAGGTVIGIIPDNILKIEPRHDNVTELHIVPNMHVRKQMMAERADAFIVMPGGLGTLDETFEILTWKYLGIHSKPVIIANIFGYWDPMLGLINHMAEHKFVREEHLSTFTVATGVDEIMSILDATERDDSAVLSDKI
ncbi:MAG TPA: TIGR00730 family Rossman fold protein [Alphaproteobacteria bacterium]|nr:TIGR00730 family Rossman fold protein [Alphaproteobacteria bacterium]